MRRNRSHTGYGKPDGRPRAMQSARPAAPLPLLPWLLPAALATLVSLSGLHAAHVVGRPLVDRLTRYRAAQPAHQPSTDLAVFPDLSAFSPTVQRWANQIDAWSAQFELPPMLVATVMQIESCGDPGAVSPAGALGLFQVMPYHFAPGEDPLDPDTNARRGLTYLSRSLELAGGDPARALAGYNGGHGVIDLPVDQWPAETQRYAGWGAAILRESPTASHPSLDRWLLAGGHALCRQAASAPTTNLRQIAHQ